MKRLSQILFWLGIICIPLSWLMWYWGPQIEIGRRVISDITDTPLMTTLKAAHAERWGIFVGLWPVTLLTLSYIIEKKSTAGKKQSG